MKNNVVKILEEYLKWEIITKKEGYDSLPLEEKDALRLKNDEDAKYYYGVLENKLENKDEALKADTIVSFWTPYCRLLACEAGWTTTKTIRHLEALLNQINATWENDYTAKINAINSRIEDFAKVCYTRGNYMLLPNRGMNRLRYSCTEDRIDLTLYECFDGGSLAHFFPNNEALQSWIIREKLEKMFLNKKISKENIVWFLDNNKKKFSEMGAEEIYRYLSKAVWLIEERNK